MKIKLVASFLPTKIPIETLGGAVLPKPIWSAPKDSAWISTS
ncbi:hypothetical protein SLEP1_g30880 [Rubroshorea leprosula]|uniref:Uncharacterized protein n=1 Tax=Rubroshorea leprosula TaxID=152421 RepID=A0AAV5K408_9ROSI|nr:hypothetical protein SLEP1_g30880 [Rubroshorea leprosula]